jgi:hypothetical protein
MISMWDAVYGDLEPQPWHYNITRAQTYPNYSKIHPDLQRRNSVRVHPYAHPQHIKVLKRFVYMLYWCGMQSTGVWSLNHDITTSLGLRHTPRFLKLHRRKSVKCAPICPSTAYQGAKTICKHMIWMWDAIHGGLEPQPWHCNIARTQPHPKFRKIYHPWPAQA